MGIVLSGSTTMSRPSPVRLVIVAIAIICGSMFPRRVNATLTQALSTREKQTFTYKTVGPLPIQADVYQPAVSGLRPVVVWIHPGALIMGSRAMLPEDELDRFLRAGFVVVAIDYRLAPETKLPEILRDVEDAHRWILARGATLFRGDPQRVAVVGASGGADLALLAGARVEPRLRAVVSLYGYGDVAGEWYSRPDRFYSTLPRVSRLDAMRAIGKREILKRKSAIEMRSTFTVVKTGSGRGR